MQLQKINFDQPETPVEAHTSPTLSKDQSQTPMKSTLPIYLISLLLTLVLGSVSGYFLKISAGSPSDSVSRQPSASGLKVGDVVGVEDEKTFKDSTSGILDKGGIDGEGSHKLIRPGGPSQTVYLTSSVIDLDEFISHEITVWGETFAGRKAGWLMDVGRVRIEKLDAAPSAETAD
ncbi:hypothetical protein HY333_01895 [Candidatus Collierbacteria bacterium]|nr:hypothetical protein [Candidatus Collierbacteria bacterium]